MGIFSRSKKKDEPKIQNNTNNSSDIKKNLYIEVTQKVALKMFNSGITERPELSHFVDDKGILKELSVIHTTDQNVLALQRMPDDVYLKVVAMHAFGAGVYTTYKQLDFKHSVSEFTDAEVKSIFRDFQNNDPYDLALNKLKIPATSKNKLVLDQLILTGVNAAKETAGSAIMEPENIKAMMQVMFNAGISMIMLRKSNR